MLSKELRISSYGYPTLTQRLPNVTLGKEFCPALASRCVSSIGSDSILKLESNKLAETGQQT